MYGDYYIPGGQSPYPRDFIIDQVGIVRYANNEYDITAMIAVVESLMGTDVICASGDINQDNSIDILDIVITVSYILGQTEIPSDQLCIIDMDGNEEINILDIVILVDIILS